MANGILVGSNSLDFGMQIIKFNLANNPLFSIDKGINVQIYYVAEGLKITSDGTFANGNIVVKINKNLSEYKTMKLIVKDIVMAQTQAGYEPRFGVIKEGINSKSNAGNFANSFYASTIIRQGITEYSVNIAGFASTYDIGFIGEFSAMVVEIRLKK